MKNNLWYKVGVPDKKSEQVLVKYEIAVRNALSEIAKAEDRPLAYIVRALSIRGLALYKQDGKLRDETAQNGTQTKTEIEHDFKNGVPLATSGTKIPFGKTHTQAKRKTR